MAPTASSAPIERLSGSTTGARGTGQPATGAEGGLPLAFALEPNQPNPFGLRTTLRFALPKASHVRLEVFDLAGRRVATVVDGPREAGRHLVPFEPTSLASGVYFTLQAGRSRRRARSLTSR